jgi:alpha-galactosidase
MTRVGNDWSEHGTDFASTLGTGGVPGTKFVWPDPGAKFKPVALTTEKEAHWKRWIGLYNEKMLSRGEFRDLYVYGYDIPGAYAIEKNGNITTPFRTGENTIQWRNCAGLAPGMYRIVDYVDGKEMGTVRAEPGKPPRLKAISRITCC